MPKVLGATQTHTHTTVEVTCCFPTLPFPYVKQLHVLLLHHRHGGGGGDAPDPHYNTRSFPVLCLCILFPLCCPFYMLSFTPIYLPHTIPLLPVCFGRFFKATHTDTRTHMLYTSMDTI